MTDAEKIALLEESLTNLTRTCNEQKTFIEQQEAKLAEMQVNYDRMFHRMKSGVTYSDTYEP